MNTEEKVSLVKEYFGIDDYDETNVSQWLRQQTGVVEESAGIIDEALSTFVETQEDLETAGWTTEAKNMDHAIGEIEGGLRRINGEIDRMRRTIENALSNRDHIDDLMRKYLKEYVSLEGSIDFIDFLIYMVETDKLSTEGAR